MSMDPKKLRKAYMHCVPDLNKAMGHVKTQLADLPPSDFLLETNVKPYSSVKRKMEEDHVKDPKELSDLVRGRLYFSDAFDNDDTLNILDQLFGKQIQKVDHKTPRSKEHGLEYSGVTHVDMDLDGTKFEIQVLPMEFKPYKQFLHQIYEKFRNPKTLSKLDDKQKEFLRKVHNEAYRKLDDHAKKARSSKSLSDD
jgi:Region found in RelA / SpoT proteins